MSALLAKEFVKAGHQVSVVTRTPLPTGATELKEGYDILRNPSIRRFLSALRWCDVCFQNNISLQGLWPIVIASKPWVVTHQTWIGTSWRERLKRRSLRFGLSISISTAIAEHLPVKSAIIPNPYDSSIFKLDPAVERNRDLIFVGRLVSDKGVKLLIESIALLHRQGLSPSVTIVGSGSELADLQKQVAAAGLDRQIVFTGVQHGLALVALLNQHHIMVIPSLWAEPFGVVALEGIACGCVAVGSAGGGLPEAIGPCGVTFANRNAEALAGVLAKLLQEPERRRLLRLGAHDHLVRYAAKSIAGRYIDIFAQAMVG